MKSKLSKYIVFLVCIPVVIYLGIRVFKDRYYAFISLAVVLLSFIPFLLTFEERKRNVHKLVLIAVMVALSVTGRFVFAAIPGFKPVTAIVVITAVYFGAEAGFLTGALSAVLSNFYFGQGPWTPFQMFTWGMIGLLAGLCCEKLKNSKGVLVIYGIFSGILYSLVMDVWTVFWYENEFNIRLYLAAAVSSLLYTLIYAASNVIFLLWLSKPFGNKLTRIKTKYGL